MRTRPLGALILLAATLALGLPAQADAQAGTQTGTQTGLQTGTGLLPGSLVRLGAGGAGGPTAPQALDATPLLEEAHRRLVQMQAAGGIAAGLPRKTAADAYIVGDHRSFWAINFSDGTGFPYSQYSLDATCVAVGDYAYYFVETARKDSLSAAERDAFVTAFEQATPGSPRDPAKGIFENDTEVFGSVPDEDGDPKIVILFMDIKDGATSAAQQYFAGYFYSVNQFSDPVDFGSGVTQHSNETEMLYVDISPADPSGDVVKGTIAHELQHLIQWEQDQDEITAVNEGLSEYAAYINGFGLRSIAYYVTRPNVDMLSWRSYGSTLEDYSRVALWTYYLGTRFGDSVITAISTSALPGEAGIDAGLSAGATGTTFDEVLLDFATALYLDDPSVGAGQYAARPLRPWVEPVVHENLYPASLRVALEPRGVQYVRYWNGSDLTLSFPDGLPAGVTAKLALKGEGVSDVLDVTSTGINVPTFGTTYREGGLVLLNTASVGNQGFRVNAAATQSDTGMVKYDPGRPFLRLSTPDTWRVATRIKPEVAPSTITGVWAFIGFTQGVESTHIEVREGIQIQASPEIWQWTEPPFFTADVTAPFLNEGWLYIPIPGPVSAQPAGHEYLVSMTMGTKTIGYQDLARKLNRSYIYRGVDTGWEPAGNFTISGGAIALTGDWMFRGEFAYADADTPTITLALLQHPIFSSQADVYVLGSEPLHPGQSSGTLTQTGQSPVDLLFARTLGLNSLVDTSPVLAATGSVNLDVTAFDRYGGNSVNGTLDVGLATIAAGSSARLIATGKNGATLLDVPAGEHQAVLLTLTTYEEVPKGLPGAPATDQGNSVLGAPVALVGPQTWGGPSAGSILRLPVSELPRADDYRFERWGATGWVPVEGGGATVASGAAEGRVFSGGWYRLAEGRAPAAPDAGSAGVEMLGNAPNPFNPETVIRFRIPTDLAGEPVRLTVLNTRGQQVTVLADGVLGSGEQRITWRGTDSSGRPVASGIYLYRLEVAGTVITRKMLLLR